MGLFNYDNSQDAHKLSNAAQVNRHNLEHLVVDIDLSKLGVPAEKIAILVPTIADAIINKKVFALYIEKKGKLKSIVTFIPETLKSNQSGVITTYVNQLQFLNAVKLVAITHHNIHVEEPPKIQIHER